MPQGVIGINYNTCSSKKQFFPYNQITLFSYEEILSIS